MMRYVYVIIITLILSKAYAQNPNWTFNSANYQYSMTFTAFLSVNNETLTSTEDQVAAFVGDQIRGVSQVQYISSKDKYLVYLTVFSNTNGETINFKIFDSTANTVVEVSETVSFIIDGNVGGVFQSYSIANPKLSDEAILNTFNFLGVTTVSQKVTANTLELVLPAATDISNLIPVFDISDGAQFFVNEIKQISGVSSQDFTQAVSYDLLSQNESTLVSYEVVVLLDSVPIDTPVLVLSSNSESFVNTAPVSITMATNVAITDFMQDDIMLNNAVALPIQNSDAFNYSFQIMPIQQGSFSVYIPENRVFNSQNAVNQISNTLTFTYDIENPYVVSITRKNPTTEITDLSVLEYTVIFSEAVDNVTASDFETQPGFSVSLEKDSDDVYTVVLNKDDEVFTGAVTLTIKSQNTIQDKSGNLLINSQHNIYQY